MSASEVPMRSDHRRLERLLGGPELARLRQRLASKVVRDTGGRLTLSQATEAERVAAENDWSASSRAMARL